MTPLLLALLAAPAHAQEAPTVDLAAEADLHFREGIGAYRVGRYTEALEHLLQSNRLVPNRVTAFNIARAYEQLREYGDAFRYYSEYVALETNADKREAGLAALDRIRPRVALVEVNSEPEGAAIYVDRTDLGTRGITPLILAVEPGEHQILLELDGYRTASVPATPTLGRTVVATGSLEMIVSPVVVSGHPEGAEIRLGDDQGPVLGQLPTTVYVPPGNPTIVAVAPGFATETRVIEVTEGLEGRVAFELKAVTGTLVVNTVERDALVEIDGEPRGFTPAVVEVPEGPHTVRVSLLGYRPHEQEVVIRADEDLTLEVPLHTVREVVAATRSAQGVDEVPASVSLMGAREIRAFGYQSLYDALGNVRGVFRSNDLTYQYLGFRGFSTPGDYGNRVLVTVDGHTMNDDQLGASYVGTDFTSDLEDVQRVEVVRGPGSALYGSNAFFGVINVVTHDHRTAPRPHVRISGDAERTLRARAGTGFGDEDLGGWISASGLSSQGRDYSFPNGISAGADAATGQTLHGRLWVGELEIQAFHHGRVKRIPSGSFDTLLADPRATSEDHRSFGEVRWTPSFGDAADLTVRGWVDGYVYAGAFPYGPRSVSVDRWEGAWAGAEPRLVVHPADWLNLTAGAEVREHIAAEMTTFEYESLNRNVLAVDDPINSESPTFSVYSAYAVAELVGGDLARVTAGGRYDTYSGPGDLYSGSDSSSFNPRFGLILSPGDSDVIKLLAGTAYRAPSVYELLYDDGGVTQIEPDRGLRPEQVRTAEVEYTHRMDEVTSLTVDVYGNQIVDLVDTNDLDDGTFQYVNTNDLTHTVGGELELLREWQRGWMTSVQHSAQQTRVGDLLEGREIVNSPPHILTLKGAMPLPGGEATLAGVLRNESPRRNRNGSYTEWAHLVDLTLTGDVPRLNVEWGLGVRNALDWRQDHPTGSDLRVPAVTQPGRSGFFSFRAGW